MDNQPSLANQPILASIVDRYLQDNNFSETRSTFRNEASFIFNNSIMINELSMNAMGLDEILNELQRLNELLLQQMLLMKLDRDQTQMLLQCMEHVMNFYYKNSGTLPVTNIPVPPLPPKANSPVLPTSVTTPAGFLAPQTINTNARAENFSTPVMVDQERFLMERERYHTRLLLFSMHELMNTYNGNITLPQFLNPNIPVPPPPLNANSVVVPQPKLGNRTPAGVTIPLTRFLVRQSIITDASTITTTEKTPNVLSVPPSINAKNGNFSTHTEFFRVPLCNGEAAPNLTKSIIVSTPTGIESLPTTNIVVPPPLPNAKSSVVPQPKLGNTTPTGVTTITTPPANLLVSQSSNTDATTGNISTPGMCVSNIKRKDTTAMDAPSIAKKSRGRPCSRKIHVQDHNALPQSNNVVTEQIVSLPSSATQSLAENFVPSGSQLQESSVVKCVFNSPPVSIPIHSPVPKTPTRITSCQRDASVTEFLHVPPCNSEATPNLTKHVDYIKSMHCISPDKGSKRDHVRSRLCFDASDMFESLDKPLPKEISTYESNKQNDIPKHANSTFGDDNDNDVQADLSFIDDVMEIFADVSNEPHFPCGGVDFSDHPTSNHLKDNFSMSSHECEGEQVISDLPSTAAKVLSEKDMNIQGPDSLTAMESFKTMTPNLSSKRNRRHSFDKEN